MGDVCTVMIRSGWRDLCGDITEVKFGPVTQRREAGVAGARIRELCIPHCWLFCLHSIMGNDGSAVGRQGHSQGRLKRDFT